MCTCVKRQANNMYRILAYSCAIRQIETFIPEGMRLSFILTSNHGDNSRHIPFRNITIELFCIIKCCSIIQITIRTIRNSYYKEAKEIETG